MRGIRFILLLALVLGAPATVQACPDQPVKDVIVPQPPGGGFDLVARTLAEPLARAAGQSGGGGEPPGRAARWSAPRPAAKSEADGYTLLLGA